MSQPENGSFTIQKDLASVKMRGTGGPPARVTKTSGRARSSSGRMSVGDGFGDLQERTACMRECATLAMDQA